MWQRRRRDRKTYRVERRRDHIRFDTDVSDAAWSRDGRGGDNCPAIDVVTASRGVDIVD